MDNSSGYKAHCHDDAGFTAPFNSYELQPDGSWSEYDHVVPTAGRTDALKLPQQSGTPFKVKGVDDGDITLYNSFQGPGNTNPVAPFLSDGDKLEITGTLAGKWYLHLNGTQIAKG